MPNNATISKITLPSGNTYDLKDAFARSQIDALKGTTSSVMSYIGTTSTELVDGAATSPITLVKGDDTETHVPAQGEVAVYDNQSFAWTGDQWDQLGSAGPLKALAYKDSVSGTYKPSGTISKPSFTGSETSVSVSGTPTGTVSTPTFAGTQGNVSVSGIPKGTVSAPTFKGSEGTVSVSGTPSGTVSVSTGAPASSETANYTPAGTVTVNPTTATIQQITNVGKSPAWTASVADENLTIDWDAGAVPTRAGVSVATGVQNATFVGTGTKISGTFSGSELTSSGTFTPAGTNTAPTFSGSELTSTGNFTPVGTVSAPKFTGNALTSTGTFTPEGEVSTPTFTGTEDTITSK